MLAGVQLFSLRKYLKDEAGYERVFSRVHEMGAEVVQLSGGKPVPAEFIRGLTEKYSLPVCVTHDNFDRLQNDLAGLVKEHRTYGCGALGIGMMPVRFRTGKLADIAAFAGVLNSLAESLAGEGMTIAYHNHWFEFDEVEGHVIYDYLIENTLPSVRFIPDTYWIRFVGRDTVSYLKKLAGRVDTLHLKDYKCKLFRAVGKGNIDFLPILAAAKECGVRYAVAELDMSPRPFASAEYSLSEIKRLLGAD